MRYPAPDRWRSNCRSLITLPSGVELSSRTNSVGRRCRGSIAPGHLLHGPRGVVDQVQGTIGIDRRPAVDVRLEQVQRHQSASSPAEESGGVCVMCVTSVMAAMPRMQNGAITSAADDASLAGMTQSLAAVTQIPLQFPRTDANDGRDANPGAFIRGGKEFSKFRPGGGEIRLIFSPKDGSCVMTGAKTQTAKRRPR